MKTTRDMSQKEFAAACKRYGFVGPSFLGYYKLAPPFSHVHVCALNAGSRRRVQLANLLQYQARYEREQRAAASKGTP